MYGANGKDDSLHAGLESPTTYGGAGFTNKSATWTWVGEAAAARVTVEVPSSGIHTIRIWQREDGTRLDKIIVSNISSYTPDGIGPPESPMNIISTESSVDENSIVSNENSSDDSSSQSYGSSSILTGTNSIYEDLNSTLLVLNGSNFILEIVTAEGSYLFGCTYGDSFESTIIDDFTFDIIYSDSSEIEEFIHSLFDENEIIDILLVE
ncbi:hypothetical protein LNTAR_22394 [Lentisphaera araneosa HTCC2155]|uniref:Gylcosyl hydrolase 115 C-terminal domain-containing protein n=1 Tax=Lentisphaera araneosa HTCC2155 TaxID=313628 RepID=A6DG70_9BACT|nr:hypothetical protein [Lentisphaera araneosa]EDM29187.1 hypothetical protein LNTAR_22394 [Lentisphaera araneosa HTCC2155]